MRTEPADLSALPGSEIVLKGLEDLDAGRETAEGAAVQVAATRLRSGGLSVPRRARPAPKSPATSSTGCSPASSIRIPATTRSCAGSVNAEAFRVKLERALE